MTLPFAPDFQARLEVPEQALVGTGIGVVKINLSNFLVQHSVFIG